MVYFLILDLESGHFFRVSKFMKGYMAQQTIVFKINAQFLQFKRTYFRYFIRKNILFVMTECNSFICFSTAILCSWFILHLVLTLQNYCYLQNYLRTLSSQYFTNDSKNKIIALITFSSTTYRWTVKFRRVYIVKWNEKKKLAKNCGHLKLFSLQPLI